MDRYSFPVRILHSLLHAGLARRTNIGHNRFLQRRPSLSEKEVGNAISRLRVGGRSAEEAAASNEMASLISLLIAALPESLRDAIRLSTVEELLPSEIAEVLETSEASVRSRLFRARQILKEKLMALGTHHGNAR